MAIHSTEHLAAIRLDPDQAYVWQGEKRIPLRAREMALVRYLATRPNEVVSKQELLQNIWEDKTVSPGTLRVQIRAVRKALGDDAARPGYIETVGRQGYRWIAPGVQPPAGQDSQHILDTDIPNIPSAGAEHSALPPPSAGISEQPAQFLVGRQLELDQLHALLTQANMGTAQFVLVTGEAGIGKTQLIQTFQNQLAAQEDTHWLLSGQCFDHAGTPEAYAPVFAALEHLGSQTAGPEVITTLRQFAPLWLRQLPALIPPDQQAALHTQVAGASRQRMIREMIQALAALASRCPVILIIEDLHWADASSLDLLNALIHRNQQTRLLIVGTHRPADELTVNHPLKRLLPEWQVHALGTTFPLSGLSATDIETYLDQRFPAHTFPPHFAHLLFSRTEGNPLFVGNMLDELLAQELLCYQDGQWQLQVAVVDVPSNVPPTLRQLIHNQMARLNFLECQLLEAGSVIGVEFSAAEVAAAIEDELERIEEGYDQLAQRSVFVRQAGFSVWPDGTETSCYGFVHVIYQQLWHERVPSERRQRWHRQTGFRLESAYGERADEVAAQLASHFTEGREYQRAVAYIGQAGQRALERHAYYEALDNFTTGLTVLQNLPETSARLEREISLQLSLHDPLMALQGFNADDVMAAYQRAWELCQKTGATTQVSRILQGLVEWHQRRGQLRQARALAERFVQLAQEQAAEQHDETLLRDALLVLGETCLFQGAFIDAQEALTRCIDMDTAQRSTPPTNYHEAIQERAAWHHALVLCYLGYPDQALRKSEESFHTGQELGGPYGEAWGSYGLAFIHMLRWEEAAAQAHIDRALQLALEYNFSEILALCLFLQSWFVVLSGQVETGMEQFKNVLSAYRASGTTLGLPSSLGFCAYVHGRIGKPADGLPLIEEAFAVVARNEERLCEADLYSIKGDLLVQMSVTGHAPQEHPQTQDHLSEAEACFQQGLAMARRQQTKSLELRAATSLARLWQQQGKVKDAYHLLSDVYGWFTEGFETRDLQEARAVLEELRS